MTIIWTIIAALIAAASIFINVCLIIERGAVRKDTDSLIEKGAKLEQKLDDASKELAVYGEKLNGMTISNRTLRGENKSLKEALKAQGKNKYKEWTNSRKAAQEDSLEIV